jgi:hypothetical protein
MADAATVLAAISVGGIALAEAALFRTAPSDLTRRLGFVASDMRMVLACLAASLPMWLFLPLASVATRASLRWRLTGRRSFSASSWRIEMTCGAYRRPVITAG